MDSQRRAGHSLIEFIGVLALLGVLAAVTAPAVLRQMDQAARTKESTDLTSISNALVLQVLNGNPYGTNKIIPSETTWAKTVADWTRFPSNRISINNRGYARAFLIDTQGWFGAFSLPYTQTVLGAFSAPANARLMVVGCTARSLPVSSGRPGNTEFNAIWNTATGSKPSTATWTSWAGRGEDLFIQRINFDQLFHRLVVVNRDPFSATPRVSIDNLGTYPITNNTVQQSWYLDGSMVGLCDANSVPIQRFPLTKDISYAFEGSVWYSQIVGGTSNEAMAQDFAAQAAKFLASQWYPGAHQGGDQQGALVAMFNFMLVYGLWANQCPHFPQHGANPASVPEYELLDAVGGNSRRLDEFTGNNGLLK